MDYGKGEQTGPRLCRHRTHLRLRVTVLKTKLAGGQVAGNNQKQQRRILLQQELTDQSLWGHYFWGISPGILLVNYLKMLGTLKRLWACGDGGSYSDPKWDGRDTQSRQDSGRLA